MFRYQGGSPLPIHVDGGWCPGYKSAPAAPPQQFNSIISYVNPNAECPVCHERVFFYQSPNGGRVFFDDLGWPWQKHPCTDKQKSQQGPLKTTSQGNHSPFRNRQGETLEVYNLVSITERGKAKDLHFRTIQGDRSFKAGITNAELKDQRVTAEDIRSAPSFVVRKYPAYRLLEFISARKKCVDLLRLARPQPQPKEPAH